MNASTRSRDAFATRSRRTLPAPFLLTRWVRAVFAAFTTTRVAETANMVRDGASRSATARAGRRAAEARARGGGGGGLVVTRELVNSWARRAWPRCGVIWG